MLEAILTILGCCGLICIILYKNDRISKEKKKTYYISMGAIFLFTLAMLAAMYFFM